MKNPLLCSEPLPIFNEIKVEHIEPAISTVLSNNREQLERQLSDLKNNNWQDVCWQSLMEAIEQRDDDLNKVWAPVSHLNGVQNNNELRAAYTRSLANLTEYSTEVSQNTDLFNAYQALKNSPEFGQLEASKQKSIDNALRDFRLAGVDLSSEKRQRYSEIRKRLSELGTQFSNNVLDSTQGWYKHVLDKARLGGLPESALSGAKQAAQQRKLDGWVFTLDGPSYLAIMMHADDDELRKEIYRAYVTRASSNSWMTDEKGSNTETNQWDNQIIMVESLSLRDELACLVGFENYAEYSLATKMATSTDEVLGFLNQLVGSSKPAAQQELAELRAFAKKQYETEQIEAWDLPYFSEKFRQAIYEISEEELRAYFPVDKVKQGLFKITGRLFNIDIEIDNSVSTWCQDAEYYQVKRDGKVIAGFYLDLFARSDKRGGAWMAECRSRRQSQLPVAFLTCNFMPPTKKLPCLLTHSEVCTLFHEFGHGLHHMLTQIDCVAVGGINGVAWDAVELPSQFLENWCWQAEVIPMISSHYENGEALPEDALNKLLKAKNFQAAMQMLRQLEFALFDFKLHSQCFSKEVKNEKGKSEILLDPQTVLDQVREQVAVFVPPKFNKFQYSFSHIFAGGYAAGYYSYKWAEVLSADAFSLFEEKGLFDRQTAESFLHNILEKGGSEDALSLFKKFRGREPQVEPLLKHCGIAKNS